MNRPLIVLALVLAAPVTRDRPCLPGQRTDPPQPAELHTDGALPPFSSASRAQKLASPTFHVPS